MVDAVYEMYRMVQSLEGMYTNEVIYQFKIIYPSTAWLIQFVIVSKGQILYCQNLHHRCGTVFRGYILNVKCGTHSRRHALCPSLKELLILFVPS